MSRIQASRAGHARLARVVLLVGALFCFGLGQVLGHPLLATPSSSAPPHTMARQVTLASGAFAATHSRALSQPAPLATPPAHQSDHAKSSHHDGASDGSGDGSKHGNGHHGNGGDN